MNDDSFERKMSNKRKEQVTLKELDPFSLLLLGVDQRENDRGRSDTIMVLTVNPKTESMLMLSIPRDTRTEIVGRGTQDKINHAYAFGGVEMSIDTIENLLDIPIDYYVQINMEGFQEIVNSVGGVTIDNPFAFKEEGLSFPKGINNLNGEQALAYSRMRYEDPNGDFGRQKRQRQIVTAVIKKGASLSSLTRFDDLFKALGSNVKTNLSFSQMVSIQQKYSSATKVETQAQLQGTGSNIDGTYYYVISDENKLETQLKLKKHLGLIK